MSSQFSNQSQALEQPWWRELNRYHWLVFLVSALGWLFDTMDQQLFALARLDAVIALRGLSPTDENVLFYGGVATCVFMIGWATGGILFGIMGDRVGRARTMLITIIVYSSFTGLSALSVGFWDFALYRFLSGLGVGGEFAVGVSLLAEVMPERARPHALGWLQACSTIGNVCAAGISIGLAYAYQANMLGELSPWRLMFVVGALPALLVIVARSRLHEPDKWLAKKDAARSQLGSMRDLFSHPRWRKNALVGMLLAVSGVVGLWGIGFFSYDLVKTILRSSLEGHPDLRFQLTLWAGITSFVQNAGGFLGIHTFRIVTTRWGRRPTFALMFLGAMLSTAFAFWFIETRRDILWMIPLMGFFQLALFGGYAIYFPELFPTHLRSTGTSFCYNIGRYLAAIGPLSLGLLAREVFRDYDDVTRFRYAGVTMCAFFLVGLAVLPFAPETKGEPLPD